MSSPFHFSGSLWLCPYSLRQCLITNAPLLSYTGAGPEGNVKILIQVNLLAKPAAPSDTGRVGVSAWEWSKGRSAKVTGHRRKRCPRRFSGEEHGNQKAWVQMPVLGLSTWPALGNPCGLWTLCFEASVSLETWGAVGVLWESIRLGCLVPFYSEELRFYLAGRFSIAFYLNKVFLVKICLKPTK